MPRGSHKNLDLDTTPQNDNRGSRIPNKGRRHFNEEQLEAMM